MVADGRISLDRCPIHWLAFFVYFFLNGCYTEMVDTIRLSGLEFEITVDICDNVWMNVYVSNYGTTHKDVIFSLILYLPKTITT